MTFDERVTALRPLGFTDRQTAFLVTVALHSGFCLRRQYATFAGVEYGKNVRDFLDRLVVRKLATVREFEVRRGWIYHLRARGLYRAIGQADNRNRRVAGPALMARKLMLLDFVLGQPADEWFATEADKVALFRDRLGVPVAHLPRREYPPQGGQGGAPVVRYFLDKMPIFLAGDPPVPHFVCLVTDATGVAFSTFLWAHAGLFASLPTWAVVVVCPRSRPGLDACQTVFETFRSGDLQLPLFRQTGELDWFFRTRQAVEAGDLRHVPATAINRFNRLRQKYALPVVDSLYAEWRLGGDEVIRGLQRPDPRSELRRGRLLTCELPFTYRQFGALPGVA